MATTNNHKLKLLQLGEPPSKRKANFVVEYIVCDVAPVSTKSPNFCYRDFDNKFEIDNYTSNMNSFAP